MIKEEAIIVMKRGSFMTNVDIGAGVNITPRTIVSTEIK